MVLKEPDDDGSMYPEIVIGLVGAVGTDLDEVQKALGSSLQDVGYSAVSIHLTEILKRHKSLIELPPLYDDPHLEKKIGARMDAGNDLRKSFGEDAFANLAVTAIQRHRVGDANDPEEQKRLVSQPKAKHAWIIRSIKHEAEVRTLRDVYGEAFFLLAVHASRASRIYRLKEGIRQGYSRHRADDTSEFQAEPEAVRLITRDEEETSAPHGQQVRRTFWRGDAYVDTTPMREGGPFPQTARTAIDRIVRLLFGHPYITPTKEEYAMFIARAAAYRSASMGRQVGATLTDVSGSVIATGTNEIPKFPGGQYWDGDDPDGRDHVTGADSSDVMKRELVTDVVNRLLEIGWNPPANSEDSPEIARQLLADRVMKQAEFQAITEYQRPVHAEMSALIDAARRGVTTQGAVLYCTTFPCHGCARHIVAAGLSRVVFIEPYPKTLVKRLYPDSIAVEEEATDRVSFLPFIGIAPRRYLSLFKMPKNRKNPDGSSLNWESMLKQPRIGRDETWTCIERENRVVKRWVQRLVEAGLNPL